MARRIRSSQIEPTNKKGNLYYVRLKTEYGVFYKLGFTTLQSVEARLGYGGSRDHQYIDKVLLFLNLHDAFDVEQKLHSYLSKKKAFGEYSAKEEFLLSKNGQTELYIEDVLHLDSDFTEKQAKETTRKLKEKRLLIAGKNEEQANLEDKLMRIAFNMLLCIFVPIVAIIIIVTSILDGTDTKKELFRFWDRITGSKTQVAQDEFELIANVESIIRRLNYERKRLKSSSQWASNTQQKKLIDLLKRIDKQDAVFFLSYNSILTGDFIERFEDKWDWWGLSSNKSLPWSLDFIERFEDNWRWEELSDNESLPWSLELINRFESQWYWYGDGYINNGISQNKLFLWSLDFIERFEDKWDWDGLSKNEFLPWTLKLIERFDSHWNWMFLSQNESLPWTLDFVKRFEDKWDWEELSKNKVLPWSAIFIEQFRHNWSWKYLSINSGLPWSVELIKRFEHQWHWSGNGWPNLGLGQNVGLPWSLEFIELFKSEWSWWDLSRNQSLPWSLELIEKFKDKWSWEQLSWNKALPWSLEFFEVFKDKWHFEGLSFNQSLPYSLELMERFEDKWDWEKLSWNKSWSIELLERFEDKWDWKRLSWNKSLPWSLELIERFKNKWDWVTLSSNETATAYLPKLSLKNIDEVMDHHKI